MIWINEHPFDLNSILTPFIIIRLFKFQYEHSIKTVNKNWFQFRKKISNTVASIWLNQIDGVYEHIAKLAIIFKAIKTAKRKNMKTDHN